MELGLEQVAAHYAISSVFSSYAEETDLFCYHVRRISYEIHTSDAVAWRWVARMLRVRLPGRSRAFRFRYFISAIRTSRRSEGLHPTRTRKTSKHFEAGFRTGAARVLP